MELISAAFYCVTDHSWLYTVVIYFTHDSLDQLGRFSGLDHKLTIAIGLAVSWVWDKLVRWLVAR